MTLTGGQALYGKFSVCVKIDNLDYRAVVIDRDWFEENMSSKAIIEHAVLHELGHCELGLGHDDGTVMIGQDQLPKSIMNPFAWSDQTIELFSEHRDYYLEQMFK